MASSMKTTAFPAPIRSMMDDAGHDNDTVLMETHKKTKKERMAGVRLW